jgi:hypothetical protein
MSASNAVLLARTLSKMDTSELFFELRGIANISERREVTQHVYDMKMYNFRQKANYRHSMAHHLVEEVHPMFRNAFESVYKKSKEGDVKVSEFRQVNRGLHNHHGGEDQSWFPMLREQHPKIGAELDILESDHAALVAMENEVNRGSYAALTEFIAALNDHLNREEMLLVPYLLKE